jgi:hypothetical protein
MSMYPSLTKTVLALMLTFAAAVAASAQGPVTTNGYCNGGPITLIGGELKFYFAIDDVNGAPGSEVTLRVYNAEGTVVVGKKVTLAAGKTVTLPYQGSGLLRVQATYDIPDITSGRRRAVSSVDVSDFNGFRTVIPVSCTVQDNIGR